MDFWITLQQQCEIKKTKPTILCKELGLSTSMPTSWKNGRIPNGKTLQKIADYFGVSVDYLLGKTETNTEPTKVTKSTPIKIPVYGKVAAGIPLEAITDIEDWEELPESMAATGEYAALKIHGDSMEPRMTEGDVVIVHLQPDIESGETAIVIIGDADATCKRVQKTPDGILLISINQNYAPMFYSNKQIDELPIRIFGKVVELRAKF